MRPSGVRSNSAPHASSSVTRSGASWAWIWAMRQLLFILPSHVVDDARRAQPDVDVSQRDREQRAPGEQHVVAVERADAAPRVEPCLASPRARETVDLPADEVPQRVAAECVTREQDHVDQHHECPDADAEFPWTG